MSGVMTDRDIAALAPELIKPYDPHNLQPSSYDLTLYNQLLKPHPGSTIDLDFMEPGDHMDRFDFDSYVLEPGDAVLGCTVETIRCPNNYTARVDGKSSLGRIFLAVHVTAGVVDCGFLGQITLEIVNHGPWRVVLKPGMKIAQLSYFPTNGSCARPYGSDSLGSHYQRQTGPTPAAGRRALIPNAENT